MEHHHPFFRGNESRSRHENGPPTLQTQNDQYAFIAFRIEILY